MVYFIFYRFNLCILSCILKLTSCSLSPFLVSYSGCLHSSVLVYLYPNLATFSSIVYLQGADCIGFIYHTRVTGLITFHRCASLSQRTSIWRTVIFAIHWYVSHGGSKMIAELRADEMCQPNTLAFWLYFVCPLVNGSCCIFSKSQTAESSGCCLWHSGRAYTNERYLNVAESSIHCNLRGSLKCHFVGHFYTFD